MGSERIKTDEADGLKVLAEPAKAEKPSEPAKAEKPSEPAKAEKPSVPTQDRLTEPVSVTITPVSPDKSGRPLGRPVVRGGRVRWG